MTIRRAGRWVLGAASAVAIAPGCAQIAGLTDHEPYPPNGIVQITAGADHACALTRGGEVYCWGGNATGQLGHRTADGGSCTTACPAGKVEGLEGAVQISAGDGFTCAVLGTGAVQCWGRNASGELGRPTTTTCGTDACDPVPDAAVGIAHAVQVSAGSKYACARTSAGAVMCWGDDSYGQLGIGTTKPSPTPVAVPKVTKAVDVSAALVGANTCAATEAGTVFCWGMNAHGGAGHAPGLGDAMATDGNWYTASPVAVTGVKDATALATGDFGACAKLASGAFACWGYDGLGCLGKSATATELVDLPPAPLVVVHGLASLSLRYSHACGVDAAGKAWCWGQSGIGALGPETTTPMSCDQMVACQSKAQDTGLGSVTAIATGAAMTVALREDGQVVAWGVNDDGRLGHPPATLGDALCLANPKSICNATPNPVEGLPR